MDAHGDSMKNRVGKIIQEARGRGQKALSEYESKQLLAGYGIPVTAEILAVTLQEALAASETIGFPLAMKACAPHLIHKTESGGVVLNVGSEMALKQVYARLSGIAPTPDGVLIQAMAAGRRELVIGMKRDPQFGPCVMLGLGGIFAELLDDAAFRAAPFDRVEALDMAAELRGSKIFGDFRGESRVDLQKLADMLIAVCDLAADHPQISEIDINPLIITPGGQYVAADALVVLNSGVWAEGSETT